MAGSTETGGADGRREYEFDGAQNAVFSGLAGAMRFVGVVQIVVGALQLIQMVQAVLTVGAAHGIGPAIQGVVLVFVGVWTMSAATHVRAIVATRGSDITHLMKAMGQLRKLYELQRVAFIAVIVLMIVGVAIALVLGR